MKSIFSLFILFICTRFLGWAQTQPGNFIVYDVLIADTTTHLPVSVWEYAYTHKHINNIPYEERKQLFTDLYQSIQNNTYISFYPNFIEVPTSFKFPMIGADTTQIPFPFPPYDLHDTVFIKKVKEEHILSIRFYEKWDMIAGMMNKQIIAFSFMILPFNHYTQKMDMNAQPYEPMLFLSDRKFIPYLKEKLNK